MIALLKIEWLRMTRNKKYIFFTAAMPIAFFIVFSSMIKGADKLFVEQFMLSMTTFCLTSFAFFNFPFDIMEDRNNGWNETLQKVPLNKYQVITVKVIKMTIESFICIVLIFLTGYFLKGIQLSLSQWVISGLVLLLGSVIFLSLGLLLTLFSSMQTASLFSNILYLGLAILGGLWFPLNQFPKWVQELGKCTPTYHFRELAVGYIDKGNIPIQSTIILCSYCLVFLLVYVFLSKKRDASL